MATTVAISVPIPNSPEAGCTPSSGQNSPESAASPTSRLPPSVTETGTKTRKKKPYKELTLEEKVKLIKMAEENNCMSQASIAERYSIAKSNVCRILQRKQEYLRAYESAGFAGTRKRKLRKDTSTAKPKRFEKSEPEFILKPIPLKPCAEGTTPMNPSLNAAAKQENGSSTTSNALHSNSLQQGNDDKHKSAFHHPDVASFCDPQLLFPQFVAAQYAFRPLEMPSNFLQFPTTLFNEESAFTKQFMSQNSTVNSFLNQALTKHVEILNEKLANYEQQLEKVRSFLKNVEDSNSPRSPDAETLLNSLTSLL